MVLRSSTSYSLIVRTQIHCPRGGTCMATLIYFQITLPGSSIIAPSYQWGVQNRNIYCRIFFVLFTRKLKCTMKVFQAPRGEAFTYQKCSSKLQALQTLKLVKLVKQWMKRNKRYSILFYSILFYSILFYSILFYSILF